jgi:hypothetical protein
LGMRIKNENDPKNNVRKANLQRGYYIGINYVVLKG